MSNLNLLPEEIRNEIALSKKNAKLRQYVFFLITISIILIAVFGVLAFYLKTQEQEAKVSKELAEQRIELNNVQFQKAQDLNSRISIIKRINKEDYDWIKVLNEISAKTPQNVQLDSFTVQKNDPNRIKVTGYALSDGDVVAFKENLSKSELFSYVDIESITRGLDASAHEVKVYVISFNLKPDKVKNEK